MIESPLFEVLNNDNDGVLLDRPLELKRTSPDRGNTENSPFLYRRPIWINRDKLGASDPEDLIDLVSLELADNKADNEPFYKLTRIDKYLINNLNLCAATKITANQTVTTSQTTMSLDTLSYGRDASTALFSGGNELWIYGLENASGLWISGHFVFSSGAITDEVLVKIQYLTPAVSWASEPALNCRGLIAVTPGAPGNGVATINVSSFLDRFTYQDNPVKIRVQARAFDVNAQLLTLNLNVFSVEE